MLSVLEMFPDRVSPEPTSGCWLWEGSVAPSKGTQGYATTAFGGESIFVHRLSYEISCSEIPDGECVLHKCDNSLCVNPDHLETGTQRKNILDASARGRLRKGSSHGKAKLSDAAVAEILSVEGRAPLGFNRAMAAKYGVSLGAVEKIRCRQNWRAFQ